MLLAFTLLIATAEASDAKIVEVSGDVDVTISYGGARALSADKGTADVNVIGDRVSVSVSSSDKSGASVSFGTTKLEQIIAKNGARVVVTGFAGKSLDIDVSGGSHVRVSGASKGATDSLRIHGGGTSRVDADELSVDSANVTLKDAARAEIKVTKSLTCDLQRASRLAVKGKPAKVDKKLAGVAKLDLK
jgi:hypothetical protein